MNAKNVCYYGIVNRTADLACHIPRDIWLYWACQNAQVSRKKIPLNIEKISV